MINDPVIKILEKLRYYLDSGDSTPFNYERYLLVDKAPYLDAFVEDKLFPPFEVEIQMSSSCNLKCIWCIGDNTQDGKHTLKLQHLTRAV